MSDVLDEGPFFHGTKADLRVGESLTAGRRSNYRPEVLCMEVSTAAAFVAAGVALIIGLLGPAMSARTTRETLRHQRKLATDERLWHRRAETYVALLEWAGVIRAVGTSEEELSEPALMRRTADGLRMPVELEARMTAYASGTVYASARDFQQGIKEFLHVTAQWLEEQSPDDASELQSLCEAAATRSDYLADRMAQLISDDLHGLLPDDAGRASFPSLGR